MDLIKKHEWPVCAEQSIKYIHAQCQKFSQSGVPSPAQLTTLIDIIDEFIFRYLPIRVQYTCMYNKSTVFTI